MFTPMWIKVWKIKREVRPHNEIFIFLSFSKIETFIIRYRPELQNSLNLHHDASEFSVILNLSKEGEDFEGGGTYFPQHELLLKAPKGHLVMHPGRMTHYHGVRPITSGERYVIVSFCKFDRS